jgi:hypothetical protein
MNEKTKRRLLGSITLSSVCFFMISIEKRFLSPYRSDLNDTLRMIGTIALSIIVASIALGYLRKPYLIMLIFFLLLAAIVFL